MLKNLILKPILIPYIKILKMKLYARVQKYEELKIRAKYPDQDDNIYIYIYIYIYE